MKSFFLTILLLSFLAANVPSQSPNNTTLLKTADGILWVNNGDTNNFTLEIKGENVHPAKEFPFIVVDNLMLEIKNASFDEIFPSPPKSPLTNAEILLAHQNWEIKYIKESLRASVTTHQESIKPKVHREALLWGFSVPDTKSENFPYEQLFVTTVVGKYVVTISAPVFKKEQSNQIGDFLIATMTTIKTSEKPFELQELQKQIRATASPTKTIPKTNEN